MKKATWLQNSPYFFRAAVITMALLGALTAHAGVKEQAKRMHDRLAGVPPSNTVLEDMAAKLTAGQTRAAADVAMANPNFLKVTVKNMVIPWTNKDMTVFYPFNDAAATLVGMVRDGVDFRRAMYDDIIYVGAASLGLPAYSNSNNDHYAQMESRNIDLNSTNLLQRSQSSTTGLASTAVSGVLTTRQSARAFFYAGTNRRMLRFTFINYMCKDLENVKDTSRIPDRIRQDVARSPGGDSSVFLNTCIGCHAGMDGLAGAFANYQWNYDTNNDPDGNNGNLVYTPGIVQPKYLINSTVFKYGYVTTDDSWINRWRTGPNANLGWGWANNSTQQVPTTGNGMQSFGQEIANSLAFSRCQAIKVYKTVCFNEPTETTLGNLVTSFKNSGYDMKQIFADAAIDCRGN